MVVLQKLLYLAVKCLRKFLRVKGAWATYRQIQLATITQLEAAAITLDSRYKVLTLDEWKQIIQSDTLNISKKWKKDVFDCDNFALVFSAHCAEFYEVNTAGIAVGKVKDANTDEYIGRHAYNVLAVREGNEVVMYVYEPQTDELGKASRHTRLGDWIYETEFVIFG